VTSKLLVVDYPSINVEVFSLEFNARWACFTPRREILCLGDAGNIVLFSHGGPKKLESGVRSNLRCGSYSRGGILFVVGNRGLALIGDERLVRLETDTGANLRRVVWAPHFDEALIVGNGGVALLYDHTSRRFTQLPGAANNLRGVSWPTDREPLVVGNAYGDMFVPTPNIYRVGEGRLIPLAEEPKVDLIAVDWWAARGIWVAVGYDVVLHEPRMYHIGEDSVEEVEWSGEGVYLSCVAFHPQEDVGIVATSHPGSDESRQSFAFLYDGKKTRLLRALSGFGFTCAAWNTIGDKALILASQSAKTFNV